MPFLCDKSSDSQKIPVYDFRNSVVVIVADDNVRCSECSLVGVAHGHAEACHCEHRDIIESVADSNGFLDGNAQDRAQICQAGALGDALRSGLQGGRLCESKVEGEMRETRERPLPAFRTGVIQVYLVDLFDVLFFHFPWPFSVLEIYYLLFHYIF